MFLVFARLRLPRFVAMFLVFVIIVLPRRKDPERC